MNRRCIHSYRFPLLTRLPIKKMEKAHKNCARCQTQTLSSAFSPLQAKADIGQIIDELMCETESALAATIQFTVFTPTLGELDFSIVRGARSINILLRRASQMTANLMRTQQHQIVVSLSQQLGKPVNFDIAVHFM